MVPIRSTLLKLGWRLTEHDTYELQHDTTHARLVIRGDNTLTVFKQNEDGGGAMTIPIGQRTSSAARLATTWARQSC
jgi:hypothetical protein